MIQKRYQHRTPNGIEFTEWFNYDSDDSNLLALQKKEKYQLGNKLLNEYRVV